MDKQNIISSDTDPTESPSTPIRVGLSACLAGHEVRYNGGHTQSKLCLNVLNQHFNFSTFCPEVAAGFGTPRPTMRLIGKPDAPQLVFSNDDSKNLAPQLVQGFENKLEEMADLDGYILMKNSPSCGLERVKVYQANGHPHEIRTGGIFAKALQERFPLMPIEEEGRLHDTKLFDNFVSRIYAYHNFRQEVLAAPSLHKLMAFHATYKYLLMAHNQNESRKLGRLLASTGPSFDDILVQYFTGFMQTLKIPTSKKNHANALLHILGYLKQSIPSASRQHIVETIQKYQDGIFPLTTPLTLLKHYLGQYGSSYIQAQRYLEPYPEDINPVRKYDQ